MQQLPENKYVFKGKVAQVHQNNAGVSFRVICNPGSLIFELISDEELAIGDEVVISGQFTITKIENIHPFNTNN